MPFRARRLTPPPFPMALPVGFQKTRHEHLLESAWRTKALSYIGAKKDTGSILTNLAYLGGMGANLFVDPTFLNWTGTFPTDALDDWLENVGNPPQDANHYVTDASPGVQMHTTTDTIQLAQDAATAGDTYRLGVITSSTPTGGMTLKNNAGFTLKAITDSDYVDYIADGVRARLDIGGGLRDWILSEAYLKKVGELDIQVAGTTTLGVAGKQGQRAGALGAEASTDGALENWASATDLTSWTETIAGTSTINQETSDVHGGSNACRMDIDGAGSLAKIAQAVSSAVIGDIVKVTFWAKADAAANIQVQNSSFDEFALTTAWTRYEVDVVLGTTTITFARGTSSANRSIYIDDISIKIYTTPHAVRLDGATSKLSMTGPKIESLDNLTIALEFYGFTSGLTSKVLAQKSTEWTVEINASNQIQVTRNRATTDEVVATVNTISELEWHELVVTIDSNGYVDIWLDGNLEPTYDVSGDGLGSGAVVTGSGNSISWGGTTVPDLIVNGVLDEWGIWGRVLSDREIANWFQAWTGDSYTTPTLASFLTHMDSLTGVDVRGWGMEWPSDDVSSNIIESIHSTTTPGNPQSVTFPNGDLESWLSSTNADNWTENLNGASTINRESTEVHGGTYAANYTLDGSGSPVALSRTVTVEVGDLIKITFWAKADSVAGSPYIRVDISSITGTARNLTTEWAQYTQIQVATSTTPGIVLNHAPIANRIYYIDDVEIEVIGKTAGRITGTTTQDLAGKTGELAGTLGTEVVDDPDFGSWSGTFPNEIPNNWHANGTRDANNYLTDVGGAVRHVSDNTSGATGMYIDDLIVGQTYRLTITVTDVSLGGVYLNNTGLGVIATLTSPGSYSYTFTATNVSLGIFRNGACDVTYTGISVKPYTAPSAVLADGATSLITVVNPSEFANMDDFSIFSVVNPFGLGENSGGRIIERASDWLLYIGTGFVVRGFVQYDTTNSEVTTVEALTQYKYGSAAMRHDATNKNIRISVNGTPATYSTDTAGSTSRSYGNNDVILLNRSGVDRTWDGPADMIAVINGVALSDHVFKRLHDFAFGISH